MIKQFFYSLYENKIVNFSVSFLTTLGLFLSLQPDQGDSPKIGFNTLIFNHNKCYHIHHWVYMISSTLIICSVVFLSEGSFRPAIMTAIGCLIGGSFSDLMYSDAFNFEECNTTQYKLVVN